MLCADQFSRHAATGLLDRQKSRLGDGRHEHAAVKATNGNVWISARAAWAALEDGDAMAACCWRFNAAARA